MMTAKGRSRRRDSGKTWAQCGARNHYGWWWIRACTPRSYVASRATSYAAPAVMTARSGHRPSEPMDPAFWVRRGEARIMVRANRYALAAALAGKALEPWVRALHGCNNIACVRVSLTDETGLLHVVPGTQRDNMLMMARAGRGGGRVAIRRGDNGVKARRARAVALREAVRNGWDAAAVEAALLGSHDPTLW